MSESPCAPVQDGCRTTLQVEKSLMWNTSFKSHKWPLSRSAKPLHHHTLGSVICTHSLNHCDFHPNLYPTSDRCTEIFHSLPCNLLVGEAQCLLFQGQGALVVWSWRRRYNTPPKRRLTIYLSTRGNNPEDLNLPHSKLMHTIPYDELGRNGTGIW